MATGTIQKKPAGVRQINTTGRASAISDAKAYIEGGIVFVQFSMKPNAGWNPTSGRYSLGIPLDYSPRLTVSCAATYSDSSDASKLATAIIDANGQTSILASNNFSKTVRFTCCYPLKSSDTFVFDDNLS